MDVWDWFGQVLIRHIYCRVSILVVHIGILTTGGGLLYLISLVSLLLTFTDYWEQSIARDQAEHKIMISGDQ